MPHGGISPLLPFLVLFAATVSMLAMNLKFLVLSLPFVALHQPQPAVADASLEALEDTAGQNAGHVNSTVVDTRWYAPRSTKVNNLTAVINGTGVYGFIFNSSTTPAGVQYGSYNWCNMPHVRPQEYPRVDSSLYKLEYVEVIHRHHKRTPYASNTFPIELTAWDCSDEGLYYYGSPLSNASTPRNRSATPRWQVYTSPANPLVPQGFPGNCQFPQITRAGLDDSWQHGLDLAAVYRDLLGILPATYDATAVSYRVTNNVITSQVAGMVIAGMFPAAAGADIPLSIQPDSVDSLEPAYSCPTADANYSKFSVGSDGPAWQAHLKAAAPLTQSLDSISGVSPNASSDWHTSFDHYFDNLSARLCHAKPLPCNATNPDLCISQAQADEVFRLGEYEYSFRYRDDGDWTLHAATGSFGIWVAELSRNLRHVIRPELSSTSPVNASTGQQSVRYRHNVAHDDSISRLLAILQVDEMVWPGMGSEVVFELYSTAKSNHTSDDDGAQVDLSRKKMKRFFLRVLWGGQVLKSSHPALGKMDMIPAETVLGYFDALVGVDAKRIPHMCGLSTTRV